MGSENGGLKVLMFPWLAHGHMTPFLELAKRLSDRDFRCYICSTPVNLNPIKKRVTEKHKNNIELIELRVQTSPELPAHHHTTNGLPLHLHNTLRQALKSSKPDFLNLLQSLKPDLLIHDVILLWAGSLASRLNIVSVAFHTSGATMLSYFCHSGKYPMKEFPFPAICLSEFQRSKMFSHLKDARDEQKDGTDPDDEATGTKGGIMLVNGTRAMEGKYMDYLSELIDMTIMPIGALVQESNVEAHDDSNNDTEIMDWLGTKDECSSVFVSFGSEFFLTKEDIHEIAHGLELSNVNFIWIIRFPKGGEEEDTKVEDVLPKGFLERVGDKGRVLEKWAPQAKILSHPNTGGFVSHCGWNSLREGIEFLVPIIAIPMHLDQPVNAKLVTELGVGLEVQRDDKDMIQREEIAKVIKDAMFGETGKSLKRKLGELREDIRLKSREEIDKVAEKLAEICFSNQRQVD